MKLHREGFWGGECRGVLPYRRGKKNTCYSTYQALIYRVRMAFSGGSQPEDVAVNSIFTIYQIAEMS